MPSNPALLLLTVFIMGCQGPDAPAVTRPAAALQLDPLVSAYLAPLLSAAASEPSDGLARGRLAMAYEANELWDLAVAEYRVAEQLNPKRTIWPTRQAVCMAQAGDIPGARKQLRQTLASHGRHASAWQRLAEMLFENGEFSAALDAAEKASKLSANDPAAMVTVARCYNGLDRIEEAIELLEEVVALDPGYGHAAFVLGRLYQQAGRDPSSYEPLVDRGTGAPQRFVEGPMEKKIPQHRAGRAVRIQRAVNLLETGRAANAVRLLTTVLRHHPDDYGARVNLGIAQQALRQFEPALASFEQAIASDAEGYRAHLSKANCLLTMGRFQESLLAARIACDKSPAEWQSHFVRGRAAMSLQNWPQALDALTQANRIRPNNGRIELGFFEYFTATEQHQNAARALLAASKHSPEDPAIWVNLTLLYANAKQFESAHESLLKAQALLPGHPKVVRAASLLADLEAQQP